MALTPGTRLGPYEILTAIGAGGMGEVYRARDTRLDRTVAIKVLLESYGSDPDRRQRFEREAKLVASLDHPHICALHDVGRAGDIDYLVMPYLEGETLAAKLKAGPLPLAQALEIAGQIADALDRAHRRGIVHRDLKPGNVMLTKTGVRLLDFGLAFTHEAAQVDPADVVTRPALTQMGAILGTLPYMAPEQLAGQRADARADIWAFGCVLYEMLNGRRPFVGDSEAALVSAIMSAAPPPLADVAPSVPRAIDAVVSGALVKDRDERWQHMHDVKRALAMASLTAPIAATAAQTPGRRGRAPLVAIAALGVATLALGWFALHPWRRADPAPSVRFDVAPIGNGVITSWTDTTPYFAVSPDGTRIAFVATTDGATAIWIKRIDGDAPEKLADTAGGWAPFWSPDGRSIGFFAGGSLKRKELDGAAAQVICAVGGTGQNGAWSRSGIIIFNGWGEHGLMRVAETGGTPTRLLEGEVSYGFPSFLPDGRHYTFVVPDLSHSTAKGFVGSIDSEKTVALEGVASRSEFVDGRLVFWRDGSLVSQPFDESSFKFSGQATVLADEVHAFSITGYASFSTSPTLLVYQAGPTLRGLVWADRQGVESATIAPPAEFGTPRLSPDGSRVAVPVRDQRLGTNDVFIHEIARSLTRRLTSERGTENTPLWTPDGKSVIYAADRRGPPSLHSRSADGAGAESEVVPLSVNGPQSPGSFTVDGRSIVFVQANAGTGYDIMIAPLDHSAPAKPVVATKGRDASPRLSSDGKWLAYHTTESGQYEVYVQPLHDPLGRRQVSRDGGVEPRWRGDGKELFYLGGPDRTQMMAIDMTPAGTVIEPGIPRVLFVRQTRVADFDVAADGKRFLMVTINRLAERGTLSAWLNWMK